MSQKYNALFTTDPFGFIKTYTVDIKTWFENLMRSATTQTRTDAMYKEFVERQKVGAMNLEPVGGLLGFGVDTVEFQFARVGAGIDAYWVPYHAGEGLPGWADVPRRNPTHPFVFTAGMNGCAFVVTDSPLGGAYMRVYHNQHPDNQNVWQSIHGAGRPIISIANFDEYGGGPLGHGINPVAFNFLYYRNSGWNYVFQPQSFNALSLAPARRLVGQASMRSVF